jgi:tetratricopeptide (TPR) repeat protein
MPTITRTDPQRGRATVAALGTVALFAVGLIGCTTTAASPDQAMSAIVDAGGPAGQPAADAAGQPVLAGDPAGQPGADAAGRTADVTQLRQVGGQLIQEARETSDLSVLDRAERAFTSVLETEPEDVESLIGLGSIELSRHRFAAALELGQRAEATASGDPRSIGIQVDALVELGRYDDAEEAVGRMVRARPDLSSYARLSYLHEIHGRLDAAINAMEQAVIAGGPVPENTEFARVQLGDLWLLAGDRERAAFLYETALVNLPDSVPAMRGLARVAASRGDLPSAIALLERAVARAPLPDLLVLLGETESVAGRDDAAATTLALVSDIAHLPRPEGTAVEPGLVVFEADHGEPELALTMAREGYELTPSIRAADALAWALHRAGRSDEALPFARLALATGTVDRSYHYHAGAILAALGETEEAVAELSLPGVTDAAWSALHAREAADLLETLS